jgi:arylsulfatase A-like enzyme
MTTKPPNIILIVMDTAGAKHLSLYGYGRSTTPRLERLAEQGTVYRRCYAPGCWTTPSHGSLFTGLYPAQHGAYEGHYLLYDNVQHLVSVLKMLGYRTYGISSNYLVAPASGMCRGFDHFVDFGAGFFNLFGQNNPSRRMILTENWRLRPTSRHSENSSS